VAQGRLPDALAAYRDAYDAALKTGNQLDAAFDLLDAGEVYWRLGRYDEARRSLDDAGPNPSRAISALDDAIRAQMALSRHDFANAMQLSRRVLEHPNLSVDILVAAKGTLGAAQIATGARAAGVAAVNEAAQLAAKSGSALLVADTRLAHAEALLNAGDGQHALEEARAAQEWYSSAGNQEAEWRGWLAQAAAQKLLPQAGNPQESAQKALQILASLEKKWDSGNYKTYLTRPDIQDRHVQAAQLAAGR
jgi:tetratricopeptide (TPR) repeat protein